MNYAGPSDTSNTNLNQGYVGTTERLNTAFEPQSVSASGDDVYHDIQSPEYASVNKTQSSPTTNGERPGYTYASVNKVRSTPTADEGATGYTYASVDKTRPAPTADEGSYSYADFSTFRPPPQQPEAGENCVENNARTTPGGSGNDQEGWQENTVYSTAPTTEEGWAENDVYNLE